MDNETLFQRPVTRRQLLKEAGCGFGYLALANMLAGTAAAAKANERRDVANPLASRLSHFRPRAKRVIFIFMQGGPSHVDTFDFKPKLYRDHGKDVKFQGVRFNNFREEVTFRMMKPLWKFRRHGESGAYVSELFPHMAKHVDDFCFIKSMHTDGVAHGPATLALHTGSISLIRPSMGSWVAYGLGTENENLPAFVSLNPPPRMGGPRLYGNAFLPAIYQGTAVGKVGLPFKDARIQHIANAHMSPDQQRRQFSFLQDLNNAQLGERKEDELEAAVNSFELAWRMQMNAPGLFELGGESEATKQLYGVDKRVTEDFGRQCLTARRLCEAGVRFVQVNYSGHGDNPQWDQHSNMPKHEDHAAAVDKPVSGLLYDLKARGLLEDTLVVWGSEFGRTPFAQGKDGRDHNPAGFTFWLAGAGVKKGYTHGATDDYGYKAAVDKVHMHDFHATLLHILGLDHERLIYRYAGRDFRLTDVYGRVVKEILS